MVGLKEGRCWDWETGCSRFKRMKKMDSEMDVLELAWDKMRLPLMDL